MIKKGRGKEGTGCPQRITADTLLRTGDDRQQHNTRHSVPREQFLRQQNDFDGNQMLMHILPSNQ